MKPSLLGLLGSVICLALCILFLYANPYSNPSQPLEKSTILIFYVLLILPAIVGVAASLLNNNIMMYVVFGWSLPCGLYLSVVSIPSIWNSYAVVLILYLVSAMQLKKEKYRNKIVS